MVMAINRQSCAVSLWQLLLLLWKNFILQVLWNWSRKADSVSGRVCLARTCPLVSLVSFYFSRCQIRRPIGTVVELVIPPCAVVVLIGLK